MDEKRDGLAIAKYVTAKVLGFAAVVTGCVLWHTMPEVQGPGWLIFAGILFLL